MAPSRTSPPQRVVIDDVSPVADGFPVKRVVGEPVRVEAVIYADGHDRLWCVVDQQGDGVRGSAREPMECTSPGLDRWTAQLTAEAEGRQRFRVVAWIDAYASWCDATSRKLDADLDVGSELIEGAALLEAAAPRLPARSRPSLLAFAEQLREGDTSPMTDRGSQDRPSASALFHESLRLADAATSPWYQIDVDRERAMFSAWYELFPRSWSPIEGAHGTLADVEAQLGYVADMGFDVLYLAPIHPIGTAFRKGRDNAEVAADGDVGSPWAIGSHEGGHTAIHPALGTIDDFDSLVSTAQENGIDIAIDVALQCSPNHPWVQQHPTWFRHRPDGTIQYAENPPKKYQDIYPLYFASEDWRSLWDACRDVFLFWAGHGVRVFRVDNPHTKPFAFWEWLIAELRAAHPDAIVLAEAFTRPAIMHRLAAVGFTQSYSYFPWRVTKHELTEYFTELSSPPSVDRLRPSCWPNTPDILPFHLMHAPRAMFALRVFLAAMLSPSYGIYGPAFELGANEPAGNGKEEYASSEKYEVSRWDLDSTLSLRDLLADLNRIRSDQSALHTLRTIVFHEVDNEQLLCFSKTDHSGALVEPSDPHAAVIVVVANLDASSTQRGTVRLDLGALGIDEGLPYEVHDLLTDLTFGWTGSANYVELVPARQPGHVFRVTQSR